MAKKRKTWLGKALSSDGEVSSKRVAGIVLLINILIFCYLTVLNDKEIPEYMFEGLCFLSGGLLGVTVLEGMFNRPKPEDEDDGCDINNYERPHHDHHQH